MVSAVAFGWEGPEFKSSWIGDCHLPSVSFFWKLSVTLGTFLQVLHFPEVQNSNFKLHRITFFDIKVFNSVFYTQPAMIIKMTNSSDNQQTTYFTQGFVEYSNLGPFRRGLCFPYEKKFNR